jgi:polar amino acid transport system substrate-binding protein
MQGLNMRIAGFTSLMLIIAIAVAACGSSNSSSSATSTPGSSGTSNLGLLSPGTLTVGSDTSYPPMETRDPNNPSQYLGADVDLANALAKQMGLSGAKIVSASFDALILKLQSKDFDVIMSSMNDTPERAKRVDFVDYMTATEGILVPKDSSIHADSYNGLCGKKVSVERGTTEADGLAEANKTCSSKINILSYTDDAAAYQSLVAGQSDAYTSDLPVILDYVNKNPDKYRQAGKAMSAHANYGIAVRKGDTALKNALSKALKKIRANGTYDKILKKWKVADAALK